MWRAQREALERAGHRVIAVDLPGHGERRGTPFSIAGALEVLDEAVAEAGEPVLLVGLSLGGYLAIAFAAARPNAVAGLVAAGCCTAPRTPLRGVWLRAARRIEAWPDSGERLNAELVRRTLTPKAQADVAAGGFALTVVAQMLEEVADLDPVADLARVACPVWLVNGRLDHFRTQERRFVRAAQRSGQPVRLVIVPGAKHLVSLDAPAAFTRVLAEAAEVLEGREAGRPLVAPPRPLPCTVD